MPSFSSCFYLIRCCFFLQLSIPRPKLENFIGHCEARLLHTVACVTASMFYPESNTMSDEEHRQSDSAPSETHLVQDIAGSLTSQDLDRIRQTYSIPDSVALRLPSLDDRASSFYPTEICFYESAFIAGLRFPIPLFIRELLRHLNLAPTQLSPNAWKTMMGCLVLWRACCNTSLTIQEFLHCYIPKRGDWLYFSPRDIILISGIPLKYKPWKNSFFFVSGDGWEFFPEESAFLRIGTSIPRAWCNQNSTGVKEITVSSDDLQRIKEAFNYPVRDWSSLVTPQTLFTHGIGPQPVGKSFVTISRKLNKRLLAQFKEGSSDFPPTFPAKRKKKEAYYYSTKGLTYFSCFSTRIRLAIPSSACGWDYATPY
ncbi:uncharacterized protein LOC132299481 [Cornus florida]|uniref:uncharacterized protein LOC132299481 n=1 Tax=Cornus florida TaxID=4283 RepID=UPI00289A5571|nr:uncharacterized protein LOC132299481 [Cornus florida]